MNTNTVHFDAMSFTMSSTNAAGAVVSTLVNLLEDDVSVEHVMGALTAGSSRRTVWQNDKKATKKQKAKEIPTNFTCKWGEWIGANRVAKVVIQTRDLTPAEILQQALLDPDFLEKYLAVKESEKNGEQK